METCRRPANGHILQLVRYREPSRAGVKAAQILRNVPKRSRSVPGRNVQRYSIAFVSNPNVNDLTPSGSGLSAPVGGEHRTSEDINHCVHQQRSSSGPRRCRYILALTTPAKRPPMAGYRRRSDGAECVIESGETDCFARQVLVSDHRHAGRCRLVQQSRRSILEQQRHGHDTVGTLDFWHDAKSIVTSLASSALDLPIPSSTFFTSQSRLWCLPNGKSGRFWSSWLTGSAIKSTKELLAQEPENISLWAGYARLESKRGKIQSARAVYAAILANHTQVSISEESPALAMWADWAKMEWANGNQDRCTELLVSFADSRVPSGCTSAGAAYGAGRLMDEPYEPQKVSSLAKLKARQVSHI